MAKKAKTNSNKPTKKADLKKSFKNVCKKIKENLPENSINLVLAEAVGTFVLSLVFVVMSSSLLPLYAGFAFAGLILMIGGISGAHMNPAITFGLWATRNLKTIQMPVYWAGQFLGAMLAVSTLTLLTSSKFSVDFANLRLDSFDIPLMVVEFIGATVLMFGIMSMKKNDKLTESARALGMGLVLMVSLVVGDVAFNYARDAKYNEHIESAMSQKEEGKTTLPKIVLSGGVILNPATAMVATDYQESDGGKNRTVLSEKKTSRLSLSMIVGALAGVTVGGNLFVLVSSDRRNKK